CQQHNTYPYSY
nr:immunoglobulin light chain junction region [Macaca mulatta]